MASSSSAYLVAEILGGVLQKQSLFRNPHLAAKYISRTGSSYGGEYPQFIGTSPHEYFDRVVRWVVERSERGDGYDGFEFIVTQVSLNKTIPVGAAAELERY